MLTLIRKEGNLAKLLYPFAVADYSAGVNFESGRVAALKLELAGFLHYPSPAVNQVRDRRGVGGRHRGGLQQREIDTAHLNLQAFPQTPPLSLHNQGP